MPLWALIVGYVCCCLLLVCWWCGVTTTFCALIADVLIADFNNVRIVSVHLGIACPPFAWLLPSIWTLENLDLSCCLETTIMILEFFGDLVFIKAVVNWLQQQNPACVRIFYTEPDPQHVELALVTCISKLTDITLNSAWCRHLGIVPHRSSWQSLTVKSMAVEETMFANTE